MREFFILHCFFFVLPQARAARPAVPSRLDDATALSADAAAAPSPEDARALAYAALEGPAKLKPGVSVTESDGAKEPPRASSVVAATKAQEVPSPAGASILDRRAEIQEKSAGGRLLRSAAFGTLGLIACLALGWLGGAVAAGAFILKSPNPSIQKWKVVLFLPAVVAGAVVGELVLPFFGAWFFSRAQPYDSKGLPFKKL